MNKVLMAARAEQSSECTGGGGDERRLEQHDVLDSVLHHVLGRRLPRGQLERLSELLRPIVPHGGFLLIGGAPDAVASGLRRRRVGLELLPPEVLLGRRRRRHRDGHRAHDHRAGRVRRERLGAR